MPVTDHQQPRGDGVVESYNWKHSLLMPVTDHQQPRGDGVVESYN